MKRKATKKKSPASSVKRKSAKKAQGPVFIREVETRYKRRRVKGGLKVEQPVTDPQVVVDIFEHLQDSTKEKLIAVALDTRLKILCFEVVAIGSLSSVEARPGEIIRSTWIMNPAGYILVHNHPSGDPSPSKDDKALTKLFAKFVELGGAKLYDHVIIGEKGSYYSFSEDGLLQ